MKRFFFLKKIKPLQKTRPASNTLTLSSSCVVLQDFWICCVKWKFFPDFYSRPLPHWTRGVIPGNTDNVGARCAHGALTTTRGSPGFGARWCDTHREGGQGGLRLELRLICGGDSRIDFSFPRWKEYRWKFLFFLSGISSSPNETVAGFKKLGWSSGPPVMKVNFR